MDRTRLAIRLASLGRSARAQSRLKVRQPLAEFVAEVRHDWERAALPLITPVLKEELNVKAVRDASDMGGLLGFEIKPNLRLLGPKYGNQLGEIRKALSAADASEIARAHEAGEKISVDGFELESDEVLVERVALENYAVATDAGYAGAILTVVSEELKLEGDVRQLIRDLQRERKSNNFNIATRVRVYIGAPPEQIEGIKKFELVIKDEVLADEVIYRESAEFFISVAESGSGPLLP
jgi:isoleucyl-tRNA synthetase